MSISNSIKCLRTKYNLTQSELAKIAGVTDKAVSSWESGRSDPRIGAVEKIARHFNISKSEVISFDDFQNATFASNLNHYIESSGVSQSFLASKIGVSPQTLSSWCQAKSIPSSDSIAKLSDFFGIKITDLTEARNLYTVSADDYTKEELELIEVYRSLNDNGRTFVEHVKELLKSSPKYYSKNHCEEEE